MFSQISVAFEFESCTGQRWGASGRSDGARGLQDEPQQLSPPSERAEQNSRREDDVHNLCANAQRRGLRAKLATPRRVPSTSRGDENTGPQLTKALIHENKKGQRGREDKREEGAIDCSAVCACAPTFLMHENHSRSGRHEFEPLRLIGVDLVLQIIHEERQNVVVEPGVRCERGYIRCVERHGVIVEQETVGGRHRGERRESGQQRRGFCVQRDVIVSLARCCASASRTSFARRRARVTCQ